MMCASQAAQRGRQVAILEHSAKIGRKILISGGGRCNFTNINTSHESFVSKNPHFSKSALSRFTAQDFISLVKKYRIPFHEKKLGQLFCDGSAQSIVDLLVRECQIGGVRTYLECKISRIKKEDRFVLETSLGEFNSESLVIATGGLSIPQIGATAFGYEIAKQFGLRLVPTHPALDGFLFREADQKCFSDLTGISLDTTVSVNGVSFRENILFTHVGLSGPASLQASLYWNQGDPIIVDLLPDLDAVTWLREEKFSDRQASIKNVLSKKLPKRFAERFCQILGMEGRLNQIPVEQLDEFATQLGSWKIHPKETVGYRKAEVTRGGVDTDDLESKSMCARKVPGLYFIGEVVDVTGQLGGYNFQWAWSSGFAASQYV